MRKTGLLYDERYLLHRTGPGHPEVPERLEAVYRGIEEGGLLPRLTLISASRADQEWIRKVHSANHIARFEEACLQGKLEFGCADNQVCEETFQTALLAVGGILDTADLVMEGKLDNAFCAVRPPGHHAEPGRALGFCYFNNIAITARYLQIEWGVERIGIVDFDVHHGNGTQHIFEDDPSVFSIPYTSIQHFLFPAPGVNLKRELMQATATLLIRRFYPARAMMHTRK